MKKNADARMRIWAHNALQGHCAMAQVFVSRVRTMDSTSEAAKYLAAGIEGELEELRQLLKERVDP